MAPRSAHKTVHLLYGNQPYLVEQRAARLVASLLGAEPHDFTLHRFDAEDMLRAGGAEALSERIDAFDEACASMPLLGERYVVRLDHAERLRAPARGTQTILKRLSELRVVPITWEGAEAFTLEAHVPPGQTGGAPLPVRGWIAEVGARDDGAVLFTPSTGSEGLTFVVPARGGRHAMAFKAFLRNVLKGSFAFAGDDEEEGDPPPAESGSGGGGGAARLLERVEHLMENPPPGLTLLLTAHGRERDLARALLDKAKKHGSVEKFVTYDDYAPWQWVLEVARERGLTLDRRGAELVIRLVGNDHGRLAQEIEKLGLLFPAGTRLDEARLAGALHAESHGALFGVNDRLAARDLSGALAILEGFFSESPNEFPVLVGVLSRFFRQLLMVHALSRQGVSDADLAGRLGMHPFIAKRVADQAERFTVPELERIVEALGALDVTARLFSQVSAPMFRGLVQAICAGEYQRHAPSWDWVARETRQRALLDLL